MLTKYCLELFKKDKDIILYGSKSSKNRLPVFAFNLANIHPHDVGEILNRKHICVRTGYHCAQPLLKVLGTASTVRASFSFYNNKEDADLLFKELEKVKKIFKI
jgi:cysteine desulfurase/selenocysteine lyase